MELRLQPTPKVEILPSDKGIVSRKQYFVKKTFEKINQYFFPAHLIRNWRPKAELIYPPFSDETAIQYECDFNRDVQNCFVEDYAEEVYLRSPPPCFVVFGKFATSVRKLSREIAKAYDSVLIQVDEIVAQVLRLDCESAKFLEKILRLGVSLTLNFVLALLSYVAHTPEARHRGYVLCGLPCSPYLYDLTAEQQINYLFTWENKPTVFVNVLYDDEELVRLRTNFRYSIERKENEKKILLRTEHYDKLEGESEEEEEEDEFLQVKEEVEIDIPPSRPWVQLPRDEASQVWSELELFDVQIKPVIELITSRVDPQYFITVDSRAKNEYELVQARLNLLGIWKSPAAFPLISPQKINSVDGEMFSEDQEVEIEERESFTIDEDDVEIMRVAQEPPQKAFLTLFSKKTISSKYRWELSHYNYICPVSLRDCKMVEGKTEFAVVFLKYIYFMRDEESMMKFLRNPRPFALPIRPKPPARFFVVGFPYCGKTTLAKKLAYEFLIPLINAKTVLKTDLDRKKFIYQEFCRQKAERRELIRLTVQAWQDWRTEEEQRIALIEEWILYIQSLLNRRIQLFYSGEEETPEKKEARIQSFSSATSTENSEVGGEGGESFFKVKIDKSKRISNKKSDEKALEVQGVGITLETSDPYVREHTPVDSHITPSTRIIQALKHEDYDFNENGLEVDANLFFSSLWSGFSGDRQAEEKLEKPLETEEEGERESLPGEESEEESISINWCSLLPPQSLSSMFLKKKPYTIRERRKSFRILLSAASKAYWAPSKLKSEFVKWRLPCYMDIPLCELFSDNPLLLFRYCPQWLKERPQIPDPIDPMHPSVLEAGRKSFLNASVVTVKHEREEVGILIRDAIEKAEREGMRITGEVITPGGWVVDDMVLDEDVWSALAKENVFADHVYFLIDSDPEYRRIINLWYELHHKLDEGMKISSDMSTQKSEMMDIEEELAEYDRTENDVYPQEIEGLNITSSFLNNKTESSEPTTGYTILQILKESAAFINQGDKELDEIFELLIGKDSRSNCHITALVVDPFCHSMLIDAVKTWCDLKEESLNGEVPAGIQYSIESSHNLFSRVQVSPSIHNLPLGTQLEIFSSEIINAFLRKIPKKDDPLYEESFKEELKFFVNLLSLPSKLEKLKDWLRVLGREETINEIDITGKTEAVVFSEIRKDLYKHFIKKPRELEQFEMEEIQREFEREIDDTEELKEEIEGESYEPENEEEVEDVRIYGESGPLCVVSLERNNLLRGKPEIALRYYGKLYFFWDEDAKSKFIEDPEKYAPYYSPIRCLPPLRIFIVGPIGCGKTTLSKAIASQCTVRDVDFVKMLSLRLAPHLDPPVDKMKSIQGQKPLLSEGLNEAAKLTKELFMKAPYSKRQFWLENPFYTEREDEQKQLYDELTADSQDPLPTSFPELNYECIEFIEEGKSNYSSDSELLSKTDVSVQITPFVSMNDVVSSVHSYFENKSALGEFILTKCLHQLWSDYPYVIQGIILDGYPSRFFDVKDVLERQWIPDIVIELTLSEEEMIERNIELKMQLWEAKKKQEIVEVKLLEDTLNCIHRTLTTARRAQLLTDKRPSRFIPPKSRKSSFMKSSFMKSQDFGSGKEGGAKSEFFRARKSLEKRVSTKFSMSAVRIIEEDDEDEEEGEAGESSDFMYTDSKTAAEVDEIIKKEFPPLEFNPVFETYEAAKLRITEDLIENYRIDKEEIAKIKPAFQNLSIPWLEVYNAEDLTSTTVDLFIRLNKIKKRVDDKGEFAFGMKMETAEKLLSQGFYFLSKFGRWCPVQVYRMKNPIHMFIPLRKRGKIYPVAYRNYIYFIAGKNEKSYFIGDPIKYTFNEPHHPNIPLRVAVIGPPKSGKSTLSARLGLMFGLKVITMGSALRFVLENMKGSALQKSIDGYLKRGCFLPLSLKIEALIGSLNDSRCVTQGFVFDGIPFDAAISQSLAEEGKLPFVIISLVGDADFGKTNRRKLDLKQFRLPYKQRVNLDSRYKEWNETYGRYVQWNQDTYNNLYEVNAKSNLVEIFYEAYDIIRKSFFAILYYVEYCVTDRALPLQYLCVSPNEYELRKSSFQNNCPVCWAELKRLSSVTDPPPRTGLVQYLDHFYWVCSKHMEKFIEEPKTFIFPNVTTFPKTLPKILNRKMFENASLQLTIHGYGRCPVTRVDFPSSLDWEGSWDFAASYIDRIYLCKNQEMLNRFMAQPWRYSSADTSFEVNRPEKSNAVEQLGPPTLTSLPPIGFLEQTVSDLIHEALQILGAVRPVFPNLTPTCTGCVFLGLYLKVYNKGNRFIQLEKEYLEFMMIHCKAYRYKVPPFRRNKTEEGQGDFDNDSTESNDSDSSEDEGNAFNLKRGQKASESEEPNGSCWLDFEAQADKKMWSAKNLSFKYNKMRITSEDEIVEIQELPKFNVVLRYQTYCMRSNPIPPVSNCLTFIYSVKPSLCIPEKFNINTLYQTLTYAPSPFSQGVMFNPEREYCSMLYSDAKSEKLSEPNVWPGKRAISDSFLEEPKAFVKEQVDPDLEYMIKHFIPRFQLLDVAPPIPIPPPPKVVEADPIVFNPHRDYTYTMLMSDFFHMSQVLRCYEWSECLQQFEFTTILDKNLGLCNVRSQFLFKPQTSPSMRSVRSVVSFPDTSFYIRDEVLEPEQSIESLKPAVNTSLINFIQTVILEKIDQMFSRLSLSDLSYDSYEVHLVATDSDINEKPVIMIREIYPYPPLIWDIISRPYYAYHTIPSVFEVPHLDHIAHERHVSLLDGIMEPNDHFRFVRYPTWVQPKESSFNFVFTKSKGGKKCKKDKLNTGPFYFIYDFFNLEWTSFLTYPFSWAYNLDIKDNFRGVEEVPELGSREDESHDTLF